MNFHRLKNCTLHKIFNFTVYKIFRQVFRAAQGPERTGQAAVVRWKRCRVPRLSIHLQTTHEPRQFCFSRADGQVRNERNPISLPAVRALGEAHLKCCMQMCYALALITKGSIRTLIRSVEETNGAEHGD